MASKREVTVVINGEEHVSEATNAAEASLGGFVGKIPGWAKAVGLLAAAYTVVSNAIGAVKDYVLDSIGAYDRFAASQTKLWAQSILTGVSMAELNRLADDARAKFGLGTEAAVNITAAVAKFSAAAGDSSKAGQLMAAALELGAASGMDATQVAEGLSSALAGNDEWLNRLGLSNPSVIWEKYRVANGLAKDQMDDTTKALAVMTELMDAGNKVTGVYAERMESGAGAQDRLNNTIDEAKVAFGQAIQPARIFIVQGLTTLVEVAGRVVLAIGRVSNALVVIFTGAIEGARSVVGDLAIGLGKLFGNKEMEEWGRRHSRAFAEFTEQVGRLEKKYLTTGQTATESGDKQVTAHTRVKKAAEDTDKAWEEYAKRQKAWWDLLNQTANRYYEFLGKLEPATRKALDDTHVKALNESLRTVQQSGDALIEKMREQGSIPPLFKDTALEVEKMGGALSSSARATSEVLEGFGDLDGSSRALLGNVEAIGSTIANIAKSGLTFAGVAGLVGGVASIVNTMMQGDADRRRLLRENNSALGKLSKDISGLKLNVTGEDITKAQTATRGFKANENSVSPSELRDDITRLSGMLGAQGMTLGDFERIAKELGISIRNGKGEITAAGLNAAVRALGFVQPGRLGQSFEDQFNFFKETQRIDGATGTNAIGGILDFLRNVGGVTALNGLDVSDPAALRAALRNIFVRLNNGEGVQGLGKLTGQQFMDIILQIIGDIDGLQSGSGAGGSGATSSDPPAPGPTPTTPVESEADRIKRERREARQKMLDEIEINRLNAEDRLDYLRRQPVTQEIKNQIAMVEQLIRDLDDQERALRRRFKREDLTGEYGPMPTPTTGSTPPPATGSIVVGGSQVPTATVQDVIKAMDTSLSNILTVHTTLHERIAAATESSAVSLQSIDGKMDELIAVTAGSIDATDAKLEAMRRMAALERGERPSFG